MTSTADFTALDVHCQKCAGRVRDALGKHAGIMKVDVDPPSHKVHVEFDATKISVNQIHDVLVEAGYPPTDSQ